MKSRTIALALLLVIAAAIGAYQYYERLEEERIAKAGREAVLAVIQAKKAREQQEAISLQEQDRLVLEARAQLDEWTGQGDRLAKAMDGLNRVLKANPKNVQAHIEMARFHIKAGFINYRNFQPGSLQSAESELRRALQADPNSADTYVLLGHLYYLMNASKEAVKVLEKAETIGTDNPWLYLNRAEALVDLHRLDEAEVQLRKLETRYTAVTNPPRNVVGTLHQKLSYVYQLQGKLKEADKEYQTVIALDPDTAWNHGNYADFLLFARGQPDAAIGEAEKALEIMNYGMARLTLAAARYAKWAQLKRRAPAEAAKYLALAKEGSPDFSWIMPQAAKSVNAGPAIQDMVKALMGMGVPIDTRDEHGDTGLTLAADAGNVKSVALLIGYRANIEAADKGGRTALMSAASQGHFEVVRVLAKRGAKLNAADHQGYTPLMNAAFEGHGEIVRLLLSAGANPMALRKDKHQSAADLAESRGHVEVATMIREAAKNGKRGSTKKDSSQ